MCMSMSMVSMSMSSTEVPSDAPSDMPSDIPSQAPASILDAIEVPSPTEGVTETEDEFQQARVGSTEQVTSFAPDGGMGAGTTAMVAVLSVACVAVAAAVVARKMHQGGSSTVSLADESSGSSDA